jgi:hypothetical protein
MRRLANPAFLPLDPKQAAGILSATFVVFFEIRLYVL